MQTDRFNNLRKERLKNIFDVKKIAEVWRSIVKAQLRNQDLKDLYDHYDFNFNIEERAQAIRKEILNGTYKVSQPLFYRIEKKYGVCRHLVVPQPIDALVLQVLVEFVADGVLENQPSKNAFYTRDKHAMKFPHTIEEYGRTLRQQWKQLQRKIYNFQKEKALIAITDLSNYYDSIDISELRKVFSSYSKIDEVVIDLLFRVLEEISWKPDYLPYSKRGLPTSNMEGIRLLAHSFLFEIDEILMQKSNNSFTRWMDDIVIGLDTKKEAIEIISSISDVLKSRGLALNLSKTDIFDEQQGFYHFQIEENRYIDSIERVDKDNIGYEDVCEELIMKFDAHFMDKKPKYWDKIAKRYITTFSKLGITTLLDKLPPIYVEYPVLRPNLIYYLLDMGYTAKSGEAVLTILQSISVFDDISLYQLCNLVTEWEIPINADSDEFLNNFDDKITSFSVNRRTSSDFYCIMWFKAKYYHPESLLVFIEKFRYIWESDSFLRRQVTAILSRLLVNNNEKVLKLLNSQIASGISNTIGLANQLYYFNNAKTVDKKLLYYLFPSAKVKVYGLSRFIVLCSVLNSLEVRQNEGLRSRIRGYIKDPYYVKWLDNQYNIR